MRRYKLSIIRATAEMRAAGYYDDVLAHGTIHGDEVELTEAAFQKLRKKYAVPVEAAEWPLFARVLARLKSTADRGVGDTIARLIGPVGGAAFKVWFKRLTGCTCGCTERQEELNKRFRYG